MKHELPKLPFERNALEPFLSAETIDFHYGKHHKGYVENLNKLIEGTEFENAPLERIVRQAEGPIFNNGAQAWNHDFYWKSLAPGGAAPGTALTTLLEEAFGNADAFEKRFKEAASGVFGSGWAWLALGKQGALEVLTTSNADNPMRKGKQPLLVVDVWEHAYYIDYRNDRAAYLDQLWRVLNWEFATRNLTAALQTKAA